MTISREQFIEEYCFLSHIKWDSLKGYMEAIPCDCEDSSCKGWQMVSLRQLSEFTTAQARIQELEGLVREMGVNMQQHCDSVLQSSPTDDVLYEKTQELLDNPQVTAIMEKTPMTPTEYLKKPYSWCFVPIAGGYFAYIREFPGCLAEGTTLNKACADLYDAAHSWIAAAQDLGQAIPEPKKRVWEAGLLNDEEFCEHCGQPKTEQKCVGNDDCSGGPDGSAAKCCEGWGNHCCRCGASYALGQI